jgi:hypothetical protein
VAGIGEYQHAALGLFNRSQFARPDQKFSNLGVGPMRGLGLARRDIGRQHAAQTGPQRDQVALCQLVTVGLGQVFQAAQAIKAVAVFHVVFSRLNQAQPIGAVIEI